MKVSFYATLRPIIGQKTIEIDVSEHLSHMSPVYTLLGKGQTTQTLAIMD